MAPELFTQLVTLFFAGVGLLTVGGINLLLRRKPGLVRGVLTLLAGGAAVGAAWAVADDLRVARTVGVALAMGTAACALVQSGRLATNLARLAALVRRPAVGWGGLVVVGLATMVGSLALHDLQEQAVLDGHMAEFELLTARPPATTPNDSLARTDRGTAVTLQVATDIRPDADLSAIEQHVLRSGPIRDAVIRRQPADDRSNCHGWVFTGGRFWVGGNSVDQILSENGYVPVSVPRPGDVAVYRAESAVTHTAVVRYVSDGQPVLVEGKWGCTGVFLHPTDKSPYGTGITYYRSPRAGHLLAGLGGPASPAPASQNQAVIPDPNNPDAFTE